MVTDIQNYKEKEIFWRISFLIFTSKRSFLLEKTNENDCLHDTITCVIISDE